ncbi:MAG: tRNA preQ1(34) S-adenosylmethionine ribosyltransferase-isomerase QueA [Rickettsiales bacterium]|jgi:S-adenosylmethionine:tRNA ribosyltransferase-isomerase|nr:tRNA preQ1(34) S-adenosylmethionine ribosyltransferase-isomerase QueA [Rickettsiales bacterium]
MLVSDFDFELPTDLIAQSPPERRDAARMLVVQNGGMRDEGVADFVKYLRPGDVVVFNNSKVVPARFEAGGHEFTLHTKTKSGWWALCKKFKRIKIGSRFTLADGTEISIHGKNDDSGLLVQFECEDPFAVLDKVGKLPLPPYVRRPQNDEDRERYQTIYARHIGSLAAPTAGLHFTPELLGAIEEAGAKIVNITLHVGAGTWMPVKTEDTDKHKMHSERGFITPAQAKIIAGAKRVIAVGTTSLRLLEASEGRAFEDTTSIFITPGYKFKVVDVLLTNFHLPRSTLFMLVCAFAGTDEMKAAYAHAVAEKYRFFSYGDCCLLFGKEPKAKISKGRRPGRFSSSRRPAPGRRPV